MKPSPALFFRSLALGWGTSLLLAGTACHSPEPVPETSAGPVRESPSPQSGRAITRKLTGDNRPWVFELVLPADHWLSLSVEQHSIDVVLRLVAPDGSTLQQVDRPIGSFGTEVLEAVVREAGRYELWVEPFSSSTPSPDGSSFTLRIDALRPASPDDSIRAAAGRAALQGEEHAARNRHSEALRSYLAADSALRGLEEPTLEDELRYAEVRWHVGENIMALGLLREAVAPLTEAVATFQRLESPGREAAVLQDLGGLFRELGDAEEAVAAHRRALAYFEAQNDPKAAASAQNNLGLDLAAAGDLEAADHHYQQALVAWRKLDRPVSEAVTLQNLGSLYAFIGRDREAIGYLRQAVALFQQHNVKHRLPSALTALGWAEYLAGNLPEALDHYGEALKLSDPDDLLERAGLWDRQATALTALGRYDEAENSYRRALSLVRLAGHRLGEGHALANLGLLHIESGQPEEALPYLHHAATLLQEHRDTDGEAYARAGQARALRLLGDLPKAEEKARRAVELIESQRGEVPGSLSRSHFLAVRYNAYEEWVTVLMARHRGTPEAGYHLRALEVAERARARTLLEELTSPSGRTEAKEQKRRRRRLQAEISALEARFLAVSTPDDANQAADAAKLESDLQQRLLELDHLKTVHLDDPAHSLNAAQVQALADRETCLLYYFLAEPESFAWTVTPAQVFSYRLPSKRTIEEQVGRLAPLLHRRSTLLRDPIPRQAAADLAASILAPLAESTRRCSRLALLPDGALHAAPFEVLPLSYAPEGALLDRHEVVRLASASVLAIQREKAESREPSAGIAVIADPVFRETDPRLAGSAADEAPLPTDLHRSLDLLGLDSLQRLPYTAREAAAIRSRAGAAPYFEAMGFEASRTAVLNGALTGYQVVHIATHGLVHPSHPQLSGFVLSLYGEDGRALDGFLRIHEIDRLRLEADLVVGSACHSEHGEEIRGEGLVGMAHALFQAGARRAVLTSWKVTDRATSDLMERFYQRYLIEGEPPARALRFALLELREQGKEAPYYWAAFRLHGDWR